MREHFFFFLSIHNFTSRAASRTWLHYKSKLDRDQCLRSGIMEFRADGFLAYCTAVLEKPFKWPTHVILLLIRIGIFGWYNIIKFIFYVGTIYTYYSTDVLVRWYNNILYFKLLFAKKKIKIRKTPEFGDLQKIHTERNDNKYFKIILKYIFRCIVKMWYCGRDVI